MEKAFSVVVCTSNFQSLISTEHSSRLLVLMPFTAIASSATIAPRIEIYTMLACSVHRPDIYREVYPDAGIGDFQSLALSFKYGSLSTETNDPNLPTSDVTSSELIFLPGTSADPGNTQAFRPPKNLCAADPVVAGSVAKLTAGEFIHGTWGFCRPRALLVGVSSFHWIFRISSGATHATICGAINF